jgi:hypothetical protein
MTPQGQPTTSALQALVQDGTLIGSWILDPARSEVRLETRHTWGSVRSTASSARSPATAR